MNSPEVSVIIRTLNEEQYLDQLLEGIMSQNTLLTFEIVLIDSGSTDRTLDIAKAYNCRIMHIRRRNFRLVEA